jgi:hypothetical protein
MPDKNIQLTPPLADSEAPTTPTVKRTQRWITTDYVYRSSRPSRKAVILLRW